ncbi:unnamed protein product [Meloidogyne enterolobii]|uniref:Uncharacterized protein n=1 Tax=Meloidogyne enterolobii TaxID=390850 RepID=A0ACB0Y886_MELEN
MSSSFIPSSSPLANSKRQSVPAYVPCVQSGKRPFRSRGGGVQELEEQFTTMRITENGLTHMYVKVPFPESAINDDGKCQNLIGRILGPRGISVRQLEMLYGCKILIRGKGSVKDAAKEKRLRGKPEGRHLEEKLHVLVEVQDLTHEMCARKLANAKQCIEKLMVPVVFDEYKRQQLIQLAIINGRKPEPFQI